MPTAPLSPLLGISLLMASQSQPEIVVNEAIRILEAVAQLSVKDRTLTAPPGSPADGDRYMPAAGSSGDWTSYSGNDIALYAGTAWIKLTPKTGWRCYVESDDTTVIFHAEDSPPQWV